MFSAPVRACLLLIVTAAGSTSAISQPPESKKDALTAFPNLKPPEDRKKLPELLFKKFPLPVPADAPATRVPWYEDQVVTMKAFENFIRKRVKVSNSWPQSLNRALPLLSGRDRVAQAER